GHAGHRVADARFRRVDVHGQGRVERAAPARAEQDLHESQVQRVLRVRGVRRGLHQLRAAGRRGSARPEGGHRARGRQALRAPDRPWPEGFARGARGARRRAVPRRADAGPGSRIPGPCRARRAVAEYRRGHRVRGRTRGGGPRAGRRPQRGLMTDLAALYDDPVFRSGEPEAAPRVAALKAAYSVDVEPTSLVAYRSTGYVLIVGPERDALECADVL